MGMTNLQLQRVREAAITIQRTSEKERNNFLRALSLQLGKRKNAILRANERDVAAARKGGLARAFVERLVFDAQALNVLRAKVRSVEKLRSHLGQVIEHRSIRNGLTLKKVRVPLGVMLVIYESRPEVTVDVAALCVKSGNAVLLKGGSEAKRTNAALFACIKAALRNSGLSQESVSLVVTREEVNKLLKKSNAIDLVI